MELWIATIGSYEDEMIIGVASSEAGARELIAKRRLTPDPHEPDDAVYGPFELGEAYDWRYNKI
jgi:hypothetical protein